jgi:hypothetical protein
MTVVNRASTLFARALVALIWRLDHALHRAP